MNRRAFVGGTLSVFVPGAATAAQRPKDEAPASPEKAPLAKDGDEKKLLDLLDELDKKQRKGNMNVPLADGRLLRILTEFSGAKHVVELGTSNGYSGLWFCLALRKTKGKLTTYEIDKGRIKLARANFKRGGVDPLITLVEGDAHENVKKLKASIDLLFLDADKDGYLDYLKKLLPLLRAGGVVVAHNMARPKPDPKFVQAITTDKNLDTIFLNMHAAGVGLSLKKS